MCSFKGNIIAIKSLRRKNLLQSKAELDEVVSNGVPHSTHLTCSILTAKFDNLVKITEENVDKVEQLWEIEEGKRDYKVISSGPSSSYLTEHSQTSMAPKKKLFDFSDIHSKQEVKTEKPASPVVKPRAVLRSSKRQKSDDIIYVEKEDEWADKAIEAIKRIVEERKLAHHELLTVQAEKIAAIDKHNALKKENSSYRKEIIGLNQEISDLKAEVDAKVEKAVEDTIEDAKHSTLIAILQCQIQMAEKAEEKGVDLWRSSLVEWKKQLLEIEEKEALDGLEMVAVTEEANVEATAEKEKTGGDDTTMGDEGCDN